MYELVHRLQGQYGITTILVSHDLSFVYRYATKVLAINKNEICFGSPEDALTPESLRKLYGPTKFIIPCTSTKTINTRAAPSPAKGELEGV